MRKHIIVVLSHYLFYKMHLLCSTDREIGGQNYNFALKLEKSYHRENVIKFQVDWTSTSSKTTLTKNFNLT